MRHKATAAALEETPSTLLQGRFEVIKELGRGAGGVVYLVMDRLRRAQVVLKHLWHTPEDADLQAQEATESFNMLARLHHSALPVLLDWGRDAQGRVFYTRPFAPGENGDKLAGELNPDQVAQIAYQLIEVIGQLHRSKYCHGDIKPQNILLDVSAESIDVHLIDFGLIFQTGDVDTGVRGTPLYLAPELLRGATPGIATDLYALGATLYHLFYGVPPFHDVDELQSSTTFKSDMDAVLVDRILHEAPEHPPPGWESTFNPKHNASQDVLAQLIRALMSPQHTTRTNAVDGALGLLAPWAPAVPQQAPSCFVGREKELDQLMAWVDDNIDQVAKTLPIALLEGPAGIGKRTLVNIAATNIKQRNVILLEHTAVDAEPDKTLEELARQLLISRPDVLGQGATALLRELSLNETGEIGTFGGEHARQLRLMRHLMKAARHTPLFIAINGLTPKHATLDTLISLANHLSADRTRPAPTNLAIIATITPGLPPATNDQSADSTQTIKPLSASCLRIPLPPLTALETKEFLEQTLPIHARPTSPEETQHLTEGIPLRLTTMAQALLEASKQGQKPSGVTLRRAADLNGEQQRRINRLRPPLRAVLKALALTKRPTPLRLLQTILPEYTLRNSTMEYLHHQGILHAINQTNTDPKTNPNTQYHIISNELNTTILDASWSDIPNTNTITSRLAQTLYNMYTEHSASVEPLEMLQWLTKSGQRETVLQHGQHICRVYRQNQRLQAAHASIELVLDCLPNDWTKQNEIILLEALEIYNNLEISEKIEDIGDKLIGHWSATNAIPQHILEAFNNDDDQEDFLKNAWEQHIKLVPGPTPSSQQTVVTAYARALALLAINPTRKTLYSRAMRRVWALIPYFSGQDLPYVWGPLLRALMARLWRTSYRTDVLHAAIRLTNAEHIFERLNSEQQAEMLNFKGALFEQEQLLEEAQEAYENAIFTGRRRGFVATVVARATSNLVRMLSNSGQTAVARYHLERCIKECEELGYEHVRMGLLQRLAQIQTESGHPYAGMMSIEAAYRVALSSGRYDLLSNIGISLLFYYGKFGFEEKNRSLFERMKSQPMWKDRWEIYMQQGLCLIGWQHTTQSLQVIKEIKEKFTDQSLTQTGRTALHMLTGEYMLLKQEWGQAVREASQGLAMLRTAKLQPALKLESLRVLVEAHIRLGNTGEAEQRLEECFDLIKNHELNTDLPQYHHLRGQLYRAMDRPEDAQHAFLKANEILQERLEEMPEAYRKGYLKNRRRAAILNDAQQHAQLDRHRLLNGLQQILDIVQKLHRASRRTLDALMSEVLDQIINFTGANRGILFQIEPTPDPGTETNPEGTLIERTWESDDDGLPLGWISSVAFARGFGQQDLTNRRVRTSTTVIQRVLRENAPISSADATEDLRFSRSGSIATMGMRSILAFPLRNEGHINGVVYLDSERTRQFSKEDEELLDMLGNQLGPVVQRAQHRALVRAVTDRFPRIIGQSDAMVEILNTAQKVANTNVPVLILGDTGTGKELLARGIHDASGRARAPFVAVNCATLPENLVEAELFGAQRGAYTGAQTRPGFFEQANGGTLFLDEIGDLPMTAQAKILRALQEGTIRRLGDQRERNVDVRIIAATHWDLHKRVKEGLFRTDLLYRLNVVTLRLPTLEQRPEDIPTLVHFFFNLFVEQHNLDMAPPSPKIIQTLQRSSWPGNIRQLRNALQRAMILCHGNELTLEAIYTAADEVEDLEELEELPSPAQETHPAHNTAAPGMPHNPWAQFPPPGATAPQYPQAMWPPPGYWPQPPPYPTTPPTNPYAAYGHSPYPPNWAPPWATPWATQAPYPQNWQPPPWMMQPQPPHPGAPGAPAQPTPQPTPKPAQEPDGGPEEPMNMARAKARQRYLTVQQALAQTDGNKAQAARLLGITRQSIYRILERGPE